MSRNIFVNGPVTQQIISSELEQLGLRSDLGGNSIFLGQVRADDTGGKKVKALEYSAYRTMANKEAEKIINIISSEFEEVGFIRIYHSVGLVMAGEISLAVMVSAVHRQEAFKACEKTVELIKKHLPVWKREIFDDLSHEWIQNNLA